MKMPKREKIKELLVALLPKISALDTLINQGWYHIPIESAPKRWPPEHLAFYQGKEFGDEGYRIRYHGKVSRIDILPRRELFPLDAENEKSDKPYYRLLLESLEIREPYIPSLRPRRLVFIPTTLAKFNLAEQINDLFDDSPLEDLMWKTLKSVSIPAERQWKIRRLDKVYFLDFAVFCQNGRLGIETEGYTYHEGHEKTDKDSWRQNEIEIDGWRMLRYTTAQIREDRNTYLPQIQAMVERLGGVESLRYPIRDDEPGFGIREEQAEYDID